MEPLLDLGGRDAKRGHLEGDVAALVLDREEAALLELVPAQRAAAGVGARRGMEDGGAGGGAGGGAEGGAAGEDVDMDVGGGEGGSVSYSRASIRLQQVRKLRVYSNMRKPTRSVLSSERSSSSRTATVRHTSLDGNGACRKKPILTTGLSLRTRHDGRRSKW